VVVLDPMASLRPREALLSELTATGAADTVIVEPNEATVAMFGADLMSRDLWIPVFTAGRDQASRIAADFPSLG
jgi:NTE family protein